MRWRDMRGRDLSPIRLESREHRIVACLNVWNDVDELRANIWSWRPYVDHLIAVDGAYAGMPADRPESTDSTLEFLRYVWPGVTIIEADGFWPDQPTKRSEYFKHCRAGDICVVIDADESWYGLETLKAQFPRGSFDVGWVQYTSPIYARAQHTPRVFRWLPGLMYATRHHWLFEHTREPAPGGLTLAGSDPVTADRMRAVCTAQQGEPGYLHRNLEGIGFHNSRGHYRTAARRRLAGLHRERQSGTELEAAPEIQNTGHEPLRIFQLGPLDPGATIYRLHSAINSTTPHMSAMATEYQEYVKEPRQFDLGTQPDKQTAIDLMNTADVVHMHVSDLALRYLNELPALVMHHHGTDYRLEPDKWNLKDESRGALRLVSNLELLQYGDDLHWLPNPMPVELYKRYAEQAMKVPPPPLRVAHSPTKRGIKGTAILEDVCKKLPGVQLVLIEGRTHAECLALKATCHVCFDSFDLGIQNSGLEAAAMGMPVIAGDDSVAQAYADLIGWVPYTLVATAGELGFQLAVFVNDPDDLECEANRVHDYVSEYHDYGVVTRRYLDLLQGAFGWREALTMGNPQALHALQTA